jgi:erythromycin esterase
MTETLVRLLAHHGARARAIVWEHNPHVGDARSSDLADEGLVNPDQLVREPRGRAIGGVDRLAFDHFGVRSPRRAATPLRRVRVPRHDPRATSARRGRARRSRAAGDGSERQARGVALSFGARDAVR